MSTTNTATSFPPTVFLPRDPGPLPILEPQGSPTVVATTAAALEFARLEAWLASSRTLQLPLHEIEFQQQTKGPRCSVCCFRLISNAAALEMWDLLCSCHNRPVRCYTPTVVGAPAPY